ncbi:alpha/beta fold hydrolase [Streptomyces sp. NPDC087856]|uniref:alpha/beta fold hydrolase n=1 Tax=Streptomyces sp. NPDC087856 TaxID=3365811 RepID=UPI00382C86B3
MRPLRGTRPGQHPAEMADDLAGLLGHVGTGPAIAVGHSMGGQVVNLLAVRPPALVRSVIALDPAHSAHGGEAAEMPGQLARYRARGAEAAADLVVGAFS